MRAWGLIAALLVSASSVEAQRRMGSPPPDHWMTLDSVVAAVEVTDAQRAEVAQHYEGINAVLKRGAEERRAMRERMQSGERPSQEQRTALRTKIEEIEKELDTHYFALRSLLTAEQQVQFDALPRPRLGTIGPPRGR